MKKQLRYFRVSFLLILPLFMSLMMSCDIINDEDDSSSSSSSGTTSLLIQASFTQSNDLLNGFLTNHIGSNLASGGISDITSINLEVRDSNNLLIASQSLTSSGGVWSTTFEALPINTQLNFLGSALKNNELIFSASHSQSLSQNEDPITLFFAPVDIGAEVEVPQVLLIHNSRILPGHTSEVQLNITSNSSLLRYEFISDENGGSFSPEGQQTFNTISLLSIIKVNYTAPNIDGFYTHTVEVINEQGNKVSTTFTIQVDSNATNLALSTEFSPIINNLSIVRVGDDLLLSGTAEDDGDPEDLIYNWSFTPDETDGSPSLNNQGNSGIISGFTDGTKGTVTLSVQDHNGQGGTTSINYHIPYDYFSSPQDNAQLIAQSGKEDFVNIGSSTNFISTQIAQSFVPHIDGSLHFIEVFLRPNSSNNQHKVIAQLTDADFNPLRTISIDGFDGNAQWVRFDFDNSIFLSQNTQYRIILSTESPNESYSLGFIRYDGYSEGQIYESRQNSANGAFQAFDFDLAFRVRVIVNFEQAKLSIDDLQLGQIIAGGDNTCYLNHQKELFCWGSNQNGQLGKENILDLGLNPNEIESLSPIDFGEGLHPIQLSVNRHTCALLNNGRTKCWGKNFEGQLGQNNFFDYGDQEGETIVSLPYISFNNDPANPLEVLQISTGKTHTCARFNNNRAKCWGDNTSGQLGIGTNTPYIGIGTISLGDVNFLDLGTDSTQLALQVHSIGTGEKHSCALLFDPIINEKKVKCWGNSNFGVLANGEEALIVGDEANEMGNQLAFVDLDANVSELFVGQNSNCALIDNGELKCWGQNDSGQLGLEDNNHRGDEANEMGNQLQSVNLGSGLEAQSIVIGYKSICALLKINGKIKCWGNNDFGQLGLGSELNYGNSTDSMGEHLPFLSLGLGSKALQITAGSNHFCAIFLNGQKKCWGNNDSGQLGRGNNIPYGKNISESIENLDSILLSN